MAGTNTRGTATGTRRRRKHRGPRSIGRYPFVAEFRTYLEGVKAFYSESTRSRLIRNLGTIQRDLQALRDEGRISTTNPAKLRQEDIAQLILRWQTRPTRNGTRLDTSTQAKYLAELEGLMEWHGNAVLTAMRRRKLRLPKATPKPIEIISSGDLDKLRVAAEAIEGWNGSVARLVVALLPYSGLRRKELRLARIQDLDIRRWRILVSHPKGENSWAAADYAAILPPAHQAVKDFLLEREALLQAAVAPDHEALVPYRPRRGAIGYWPDALLGKLKGELERRSGVRFSLKMFRATFAQMAKDRGVQIEAVSRALRHSNTRTTEQYYARIRADDAFAELERAFLVQKQS